MTVYLMEFRQVPDLIDSPAQHEVNMYIYHAIDFTCDRLLVLNPVGMGHNKHSSKSVLHVSGKTNTSHI